MKYLIILIFIGLSGCCSLSSKLNKESTEKIETCANYDKPQDIHVTHYWDGRIHLVPVFDNGGKSFKGYVIVHMPKDSPFLDKGLTVGDSIIEIDGIKPKNISPSKDPDFFQKIKNLNFKSITIEKCLKFAP